VVEEIVRRAADHGGARAVEIAADEPAPANQSRSSTNVVVLTMPAAGQREIPVGKGGHLVAVAGDKRLPLEDDPAVRARAHRDGVVSWLEYITRRLEATKLEVAIITERGIFRFPYNLMDDAQSRDRPRT
jgi:hypothetical protein